MVANRLHVPSWERRTRATFACLGTTVSLFGAPACSSKDPNNAPGDGGLDGGPDEGCRPYASQADLSTPTSFTADVMPIFQRSCALSASCHGDPLSAAIQPYLGLRDGGMGAAGLVPPIVGVRSVQDPMMDLVAPHDPANSFLMHKMDGDECTLARECVGTAYSVTYPACGSPMPYRSASLSAAERDTVRRWIAQGAQ